MNTFWFLKIKLQMKWVSHVPSFRKFSSLDHELIGRYFSLNCLLRELVPKKKKNHSEKIKAQESLFPRQNNRSR